MAQYWVVYENDDGTVVTTPQYADDFNIPYDPAGYKNAIGYCDPEDGRTVRQFTLDPACEYDGNADPLCDIELVSVEKCGGIVVLNPTFSDPDGDMLNAVVSINGQSQVAGDGVDATFTQVPPGTYSATITVNDTKGGSCVSSVSVTVEANQLPVINSCTAIATGNNATFTADVVDDDMIASYLWTFGDGNTSVSENPTHTYDVDGIYNYTLTVTDACGETAICTGSVTIENNGNLPVQLRTAGIDETCPYDANFMQCVRQCECEDVDWDLPTWLEDPEGNAITIVSVTTPTGVTYDDVDNTLEADKTATAGAQTITVTAKDSVNGTPVNFTINTFVTDANCMGMGLGGMADFKNNGAAFIDRVKSSRGWIASWISTSNLVKPSAQLDQYLWPGVLPPSAGDYWEMKITSGASDYGNPSNRHVFIFYGTDPGAPANGNWQGVGTGINPMTYVGTYDSVVGNPAGTTPGAYVYDMDSGEGGTRRIRRWAPSFDNTIGTPGGSAYFHYVPISFAPEFIAHRDSGTYPYLNPNWWEDVTVFHPDYVDMVKEVAGCHIRTMDMTETNAQADGLVESSQWMTWDGIDGTESHAAMPAWRWSPTGIPVDAAVHLANITEKDLWFNYPLRAYENFVGGGQYLQDTTTFIKDNLLGKHFFEYDNEVWNNGFESTDWVWKEAPFANPAQSGSWDLHYGYGKRLQVLATEANTIWNDTRECDLIVVSATQTGAGRTPGRLEYSASNTPANDPNEPYENFTLDSNGGGTQVVDGLALTHYFRARNDAEIAQYQAAIDAAGGDFTDPSVQNLIHTNMTTSLNSRSVAFIHAKHEEEAVYARDYNLKMYTYEGQWHNNSLNNASQEVRDAMTFYGQSQLYCDALLLMYSEWDSIDVTARMTHFTIGLEDESLVNNDYDEGVWDTYHNFTNMDVRVGGAVCSLNTWNTSNIFECP